jgi:DMSO/TMAO reductase YedYZ molybdopterin-dependent catalytic subunit
VINRLLGGPKLDEAQKARVPPGQYVTPKWPVLHYGSVPRTDLATWDFKVWGEVENPFTFTWDEFKQMPRKSVHCDVHCVTRWSRLDMDFSGVPIQHILERAQLKSGASFVLSHCEQGYTANLPLSVLDDDDVLLADEANGAPLEPEHGYPLRLVVPKRYFWKSAKWIRGSQFLSQDMLGFWERYGYNNNADPWKEERFSDGNG